jgi:uncharacterized protein
VVNKKIQMQPIFHKVKNYITWQRVPAGSIKFKALDKEISILLGYSVFYIIAAYFTGLAILNSPSPILGAVDFNQDAWYSLLFKIFLLLFVPSVIFFFIWKYELKDLLLGLKPSIKNISATILMVAIGFFLNSSKLKPIQENFSNFPDAPLRLLMGIIMPLFTAGIPEELFFRGYLQTRLEIKWNRLAAILVSTTLFAAWHLPSRFLLSQGAEGQAGNWGSVIIHTGIPVFIVGLVLSLHWSRYRNIVLLVLTHWAVDILPSIGSYFKIPF